MLSLTLSFCRQKEGWMDRQTEIKQYTPPSFHAGSINTSYVLANEGLVLRISPSKSAFTNMEQMYQAPFTQSMAHMCLL